MAYISGIYIMLQGSTDQELSDVALTLEPTWLADSENPAFVIKDLENNTHKIYEKVSKGILNAVNISNGDGLFIDSGYSIVPGTSRSDSKVIFPFDGININGVGESLNTISLMLNNNIISGAVTGGKTSITLNSNNVEFKANDSLATVTIAPGTHSNHGVNLSQLNTKQDTLVSGVNIKTINNESLLGTGNLVISGGGGDSLWQNDIDGKIKTIGNKGLVTDNLDEDRKKSGHWVVENLTTSVVPVGDATTSGNIVYKYWDSNYSLGERPPAASNVNEAQGPFELVSGSSTKDDPNVNYALWEESYNYPKRLNYPVYRKAVVSPNQYPQTSPLAHPIKYWYIVRTGSYWMITSNPLSPAWWNSLLVREVLWDEVGGGQLPDGTFTMANSSSDWHPSLTGTATVTTTTTIPDIANLDSIVSEGTIYCDKSIKVKDTLLISDRLWLDRVGLNTMQTNLTLSDNGAVSIPTANRNNITEPEHVVVKDYIDKVESELDGKISDITFDIPYDSVTNDMLANMPAYSIKGNSTSSTSGDPQDISMSANSILVRQATNNIAGLIVQENRVIGRIANGALDNVQVQTNMVADNAITNAKLTDMNANTVKVRNADTAGDPVDLVIGQGKVLGRLAGGNLGAIDIPELTKSIFIENPTNSENIGIWEPGRDITITGVIYRVTSSTSVTFNISHSNSINLWTTNKVATTTKTPDTTFQSASCSANNYIRFITSAVSGTPGAIEITIRYREN
jgi:hypothetical protein